MVSVPNVPALPGPTLAGATVSLTLHRVDSTLIQHLWSTQATWPPMLTLTGDCF